MKARATRTANQGIGKRRVRRPVDPFMAPADAAKAASLRHINDQRDGISRRKAGAGFSYATPDGVRISDRDTLARIRSLAIPPAWSDVWISPIASGHLQATGRDARGRKQYRYHPDWRRVRDETKYERMVLFGTTLPRIRSTVDTHLDLKGMPRNKLLAVVVRLLETTFIRVGNEEYARTNKSFGLTTLLDHHVDVKGARLSFTFRGKSGKKHAVILNDRRLARLVSRCRDLPGQDLFQFIDDDGQPQPITSADVNDYLRETAGEEFTAKDFRTWAGTLLAASHLDRSLFDGAAAPKSVMLDAITKIAARLGNTPSVCRKCYIHPGILEAYQDQAVHQRWVAAERGARIKGLTPEESYLLRFLGRPAA